MRLEIEVGTRSRSWRRTGGVFALAVVTLLGAKLPVQAEIVASLEAPDGIASEVSNIQGWAYTTTPGASLTPPFQVLVNGIEIARVPCCGPRGDVQVLHPEAPLASGFSAAFNWALIDSVSFPADLGRPQGAINIFTVDVIITDDAGGSTTLTREVSVVGHDGFRFAREAVFLTSAKLPVPMRTMCSTGLTYLGGGRGDPMITCSRMVMRTRTQQFYCPGIRLKWARGKQGFRVIDGCRGSVDITPSPDRKVIFATSVQTNSSFFGLDGADKFCTDLAWTAGLGGDFQAWLSDDEDSPATRSTHADVPYELPGGQVVAEDWDDLTDGRLAHPINQNELGETVTGHALTNTHPDGTAIDPTIDGSCGGWRALSPISPPEVIAGSLGSVLENWTRDIGYSCFGIPLTAPPLTESDARIYCIEQ